MVYLNDDLGKILTSGEKELITSITSGGAFIGAVVAGLTAARFGRKGAIYMGCILFIVGAVIQAASYSLAQMTVGRLVVGFGVGSAAMIVPVCRPQPSLTSCEMPSLTVISTDAHRTALYR